jgi:HKD family nuclease
MCLDASRAEFLLHPAYSPGLAPSDFFLFGYLKGKLSDHICEIREDFLNAITEIFIRVDHWNLESCRAIFDRQKRLDKRHVSIRCLTSEYIESTVLRSFRF